MASQTRGSSPFVKSPAKSPASTKSPRDPIKITIENTGTKKLELTENDPFGPALPPSGPIEPPLSVSTPKPASKTGKSGLILKPSSDLDMFADADEDTFESFGGKKSYQ